MRMPHRRATRGFEAWREGWRRRGFSLHARGPKGPAHRPIRAEARQLLFNRGLAHPRRAGARRGYGRRGSRLIGQQLRAEEREQLDILEWQNGQATRRSRGGSVGHPCGASVACHPAYDYPLVLLGRGSSDLGRTQAIGGGIPAVPGQRLGKFPAFAGAAQRQIESLRPRVGPTTARKRARSSSGVASRTPVAARVHPSCPWGRTSRTPHPRYAAALPATRAPRRPHAPSAVPSPRRAARACALPARLCDCGPPAARRWSLRPPRRRRVSALSISTLAATKSSQPPNRLAQAGERGKRGACLGVSSAASIRGERLAARDRWRARGLAHPAPSPPPPRWIPASARCCTTRRSACPGKICYRPAAPSGQQRVVAGGCAGLLLVVRCPQSRRRRHVWFCGHVCRLRTWPQAWCSSREW